MLGRYEVDFQESGQDADQKDESWGESVAGYVQTSHQHPHAHSKTAQDPLSSPQFRLIAQVVWVVLTHPHSLKASPYHSRGHLKAHIAPHHRPPTCPFDPTHHQSHDSHDSQRHHSSPHPQKPHDYRVATHLDHADHEHDHRGHEHVLSSCHVAHHEPGASIVKDEERQFADEDVTTVERCKRH